MMKIPHDCFVKIVNSAHQIGRVIGRDSTPGSCISLHFVPEYIAKVPLLC